MLELLALLRANDFKTFIVTNYGADFVRELSESVYGVPRDRVIGTTREASRLGGCDATSAP